jgi:hypothetical protein
VINIIYDRFDNDLKCIITNFIEFERMDFPHAITSNGRSDLELINEIGQTNYDKLILWYSNTRHKPNRDTLYEIITWFNFFVKVINIGYLLIEERFKYIYYNYNKYSNEPVDVQVDQFIKFHEIIGC